MKAARIAAASTIGTLLEYYDFAVYNALAALVFSLIFFPAHDPLTGMVLSLSTFAVGYLARPLGGALFGRLGDTRGRRFVLTSTLIVMGTATVLIGVLPSYQRAGIAAPCALVALRFVQGAALGGEWAGAVLLSFEHGPADARGLHAAWAQMGPALGTLLATGLIAAITYLLSPTQFLAWGWRLPFLLSLAVAGFGLWIRRGVEETPIFSAIQARQSTVRAPIGAVLKQHWRRLLLAGGSRIGPDVLYSLLAAFTLTYLTTIRHQSRSAALLAVTIGSVVHASTVVWCGRLSDRFGRRPVYALGVLCAMVWAFGYFRLLDSLQPLAIVLAVASGFFIHALMYGPQAAFIVEQFPTRVRYAGASLAYTWVGVIGGGPAPLVFAALWRAQRSTLPLSLYLAGALGVTAIVLLIARETADRPLEH
ncbi:MAG: MFS transporter [Steroidobacteraceae bacterium]